MSNTKDKIREMAKLAIFSNRISEFHEKNLKMYPLVFFNGVKEAKLDYDLERKKTTQDEPEIVNSMVSYYLDLDESQNDLLDKRFEALETSVRGLLWNDITVEVYFNDRIVFKSKKK